MKIKLLTILIFIILTFTGCSKSSESNLLNEAKDKLENYEYKSAMTILSQIINEDGNNDEARAMYIQARKMFNAQQYESNNDFEKAIKELEDIVDINNGSKLIKKEAINKKSELEKLQEEKEKNF
ncbi:hypothetical protein [Terrisporobacter sp.]|uniref:hypothetical protein n=1 Tax=Terrisporobacter sp. TaxID=1965305 RepID=UPI0026267A63|nr:hypothetical protein [Terrisporobacter sp.]